MQSTLAEVVVQIVGFCLLASVVLSPVACTINRDHLIAHAIKDGADPIAVRCAMVGDMGREPMCIVKAGGK